MDRIDRLLEEYGDAIAGMAIGIYENKSVWTSFERAREKRRKIIFDWLAMVRLLEETGDIHRESFHSEDERLAYEIDALLARVKGGSP